MIKQEMIHEKSETFYYFLVTPISETFYYFLGASDCLMYAQPSECGTIDLQSHLHS